MIYTRTSAQSIRDTKDRWKWYCPHPWLPLADKMDSQNSSTGQENEGYQQPSELPILGEKDKSQASSDHVPLVSKTIQLQIFLLTIAVFPFAAGSRNKTYLSDRALSTYLKVLADLERDNPKFAFSAARLVGLYRRLWESCVTKQIDGEKLEQKNLSLKEAGTHEKGKRPSSAAPRQAAFSTALSEKAL